MPPSLKTANILYDHQLQVTRDMNAVYKVTADQISATLTRYAGSSDQKIPPSQSEKVRQDVGNLVLGTFMQRVGDNWQAFGSDGVTALAAYPRVLNQHLVMVQAEVIAKHTRYMQAAMPKDLEMSLRMRTRFRSESFIENYGHLRIFGANPLAQYESAHTWVDPNGYRLSDRIWEGSYRTRRRIDMMLNDGIRAGTSARNMSAQLERFLLPQRRPIRTTRPYGSDASFDGMRLARSEIARAHGMASLISGQQNPYVDSMDYCLSPSHPRIDICDSFASIGMGGNRIKPAYPFGSVPMPVASTHPQCLCRLQPFVSRSWASVNRELRAAIDASLGENINPAPTPIAGYDFVSWLLGAALLSGFAYLVRQLF